MEGHNRRKERKKGKWKKKEEEWTAERVEEGIDLKTAGEEGRWKDKERERK